MHISKQISGNAVERDVASKQGRSERELCSVTDYNPVSRVHSIELVW